MTDHHTPDARHLEFLQAVISRMAQNSFFAKGWSVTVTTVLLGLAVKDGGPLFALVGLLPLVIFWVLDAYYLALEGSFRRLFAAAVSQYNANATPTFDMRGRAAFGDVIRSVSRPAALLVHLPLGAGLVVAYFVLSE